MPETLTIPDLIRREAKAAGVPEELALAVAEQESGFNPTVRGPKLPSGVQAIGTFQLLPETATRFKVDPEDPVQNIRGGVTYLRQLLDQHEGDLDKVLAAYGGVKTNTTYVPGVLARVPKFRAAPARPAPIAQVGAPPPSPPAIDAQQPTSIGPGPSWQTRLSRFMTPAIGAVAGGMRGATVGAPAGPVGAVLGGLAGAGLGAGGAELLQTGFERLVSPLVGEAPPSTAGMIRRVGGATQTGMVGELTGMGLSKALAAPFASKLKPHAAEALQQFTVRGRPLVLPSEVSRSRLLTVAENIAEGSLAGGGRVEALRLARQEFAEQQVLDVLDAMGPRATTREAGTQVLANRQDAIRAFREGERALWEGQFRPLAEQLPLATPRLDAFMSTVQRQEAGAILPNAGVRAAEAVAELAPGRVVTVVGGKEFPVSQLPATVQDAMLRAGHPDIALPKTAAQFQRTVSDLGKLVRMLDRAAKTDPTKNNQLGLAKKLQQLAREDLEASLAPHPAALEAYEAATTFSRLGNEQLFNDSIRHIARSAPEKITARLLTKNNSTTIHAVREAAGPEAFRAVQTNALESLLRPNARTGHIQWPQVLQRLDQLGDDTAGALFPAGQLTDIQKVARLMQDLGEKQSGVGRVWIQLTQAGAAAGILTGTLTAPATSVLITPPMLARILTHPKAIQWLTSGLKSAPESRAASRAAGQLLSFLGREATRPEEAVGTPPPRAVGPGPLVGRAPQGSAQPPR